MTITKATMLFTTFSPTTRFTTWLLGAAVLIAIGCDKPTPSHSRLRFRGNNADVYLRSVADTLNDLPYTLDLELFPAQPILTASTSADGKEVLAVCTRAPQSPEGPINFLQVVTGNSTFASLEVKTGDIVRYYVNLDADAAERNIEQRTAIEPHVRRLDVNNPEGALILDESLAGEVTLPQRIEIWRFSDKRADAIRSMLNRYEAIRRPAAGWEPSPDLGSLRQIVERANQWLRSLDSNDGGDEVDWKYTPLLAGMMDRVALPEEEDPRRIGTEAVTGAISLETLRDGPFADWEGRLLEQAVWCRDIAQWARGEALSDLEAVTNLFDWTMRNIQLDRPGKSAMIHHPWQALIYGHGTAVHRGWVFVELCRQQGIDAVMLQPEGAGNEPAPLLVGVLIEDNVYLFDAQLGLPILGEDGAAATLAEAAEDPEVLRRLDVSDQLTYPLKSQQLAKVDALIVASPLQLARRSAALEEALEGEEFVRLAADPAGLSERLKKHPHVDSVALWAQPYQAIADEFSLPNVRGKRFRRQAVAEFAPFAERPVLWKARVLHFQGDKGKRAAERNDPLAAERQGHGDAPALYQNPNVRPSDEKLEAEDPTKRVVYAAAKAASSYWLGLLIYDVGDYEVASRWLGDRTLDREPKGKWADGARYNLARTYEALGRYDEAIKTLESDPEVAPQRYGNLVRAKQLAARQSAEADDAGDAADDEPSDQ